MIKLSIIFLTLILALNIVSAANVHGTIYDLSLEKVNKAIVTVNTKPVQSYVTKNGTYSFYLPEGKYTIKANLIEDNLSVAFASQDTIIDSDGDFIVDLILFPDLAEEISIIEETDNIEITENIFNGTKNNWLYASLLAIAAIIAIILIKKRPKKNKEELIPDDLEEIISIIRENDNRITQKDLRKQISFSETKISLVLADLEDKGIIRKIKKGRGNIIILENKN